MSCFIKISENYNSFTKSEKIIADFILEHPEKAMHMSAKELAESTYSSTGAVMRLVKKLDFGGLSEMRLDLAKTTKPGEKSDGLIIDEKDSTKEISGKISGLIAETAVNMDASFSFNNFEKALKKLVAAKRIYLFGVGSSSIAALDMQQKLLRINRNVVYCSDPHMQLTASVHIEKDDVVIAFSYSGETTEVLCCVKNAATKGAFVIGVTKAGHSPLVALSDFLCYLPDREGEYRIAAIRSRYAQLFVSDLLYLAIAQDDFEKTKEDIIKTRNAVSALKKNRR